MDQQRPGSNSQNQNQRPTQDLGRDDKKSNDQTRSQSQNQDIERSNDGRNQQQPSANSDRNERAGKDDGAFGDDVDTRAEQRPSTMAPADNNDPENEPSK